MDSTSGPMSTRSAVHTTFFSLCLLVSRAQLNWTAERVCTRIGGKSVDHLFDCISFFLLIFKTLVFFSFPTVLMCSQSSNSLSFLAIVILKSSYFDPKRMRVFVYIHKVGSYSRLSRSIFSFSLSCTVDIYFFFFSIFFFFFYSTFFWAHITCTQGAIVWIWPPNTQRIVWCWCCLAGK